MLDIVKAVLAIKDKKKWKVYQIDVKSAFLNGILEEESYVQQPSGYEVEGKEDKIYRLKKVLYGLKQAPTSCYNIMDSYMIKNGFYRSIIKPTLYIKVNEHGHIFIVCLYVDDMLYTSHFELNEFKATMKIELG